MTHLSLFTGIGGLDLAAEMAGFCTVGQVEIDDYCNRVLEHHWPGVPRWRDVKDVTAETFEQKTGIKPGTLALLSGGFPCQPVSCAGKRKGDTDERWLWDEMLRVICEIRPRWVVAENVRGLLSAQAISDGRKLFGRILRDLAENGYRVGWLCYGAGDVGAPHKRERVFIVAHSQELRGRGWADKQCPVRREQLVQGEQTGGQVGDKAKRCGSGCGEDVADTNNPGSRTPYGGTNENRSEEVKEREEQPQLGPCGFGQDVAYSESRQSWQQETRNRREGTCGRSKEMGHATEQGLQSREDVADTEKPKGAMDRPIASEQEQGQFGGRGGEGVLAETKKSGLSQSQGRGRGTERQPRSECYCIYAREQATERTAQPGLGGVLNGFSAGMDRTKWPAGPGEQYPWEPPRIATGIKDRVARLKALGNAVVPAQAYPIFRAIMEIEVAGCMKIIAENAKTWR